MEDIKLWELDGTQAKPLATNSQLASERRLEDILVANPNLLIEGMTLVGRQTPTEGGPLDLLGVDPEDGKLVVFELKRGELLRDAVAQIIDYASDLDNMDIEDLAGLITKESGKRGIAKIEDFIGWYSESFDQLESLKPPRMFLVGLGADDRTERMVRFLAQNSGMDISLLTFHAFNYSGTTFLAKQVEGKVAEEQTSRSRGRRRTRTELEQAFDEKMTRYGTRDLVADIHAMFRENWPESRRRIEARGSGIRLRQANSFGGFARVDTFREQKISIAFFRHTRALCPDEFRRAFREDSICNRA